MAFVLFCIVKAMNKLMEMGKHEEPAAEEPEAPAAPTQEELLAEILAAERAEGCKRQILRVNTPFCPRSYCRSLILLSLILVSLLQTK